MNKDQVHEAFIKEILERYEEDVTRQGILETPKRYIKFLDQFLNPPDFVMTVFDSEKYDEMICVHNTPFYSLCEHHIAPFFGTADIAYIPNKSIVGLSKIPRVVDMFSRRLQNQERITSQIAEHLMKNLNPKGVAVVLRARHMCVEMRGVEKPGTITTTSAMLGVFKTEINTRNEFLKLIK